MRYLIVIPIYDNPLRKMIRRALAGFAVFSDVPLEFALKLGLVMAAAPVLYGIMAIAVKVAGFSVVPGYASLLVAITFFNGVRLMVFGMGGQYVARIYDEIRARPLCLVRLPPS